MTEIANPADVAMDLASRTVAMNGKVPAAVGVPVMAPVAVFKVTPVGNVPLVMAHS